MKPSLEHLPKENNESFVVKYFDYAYYPTPWHYHPEYEIVLVTESTGKRIIGDHISDFKPGNLAFIGPNIPHIYKNDPVYYENNPTLKARSIVVHFTGSAFGRDFLFLPESLLLRGLLEKASSGLDIHGDTNIRVSEKLIRITGLSGLKRWLCLLDILTEIAESKETTPITRSSLVGYNEKESIRLCKVLDWMTANFEKNIRLNEAATIAGMHENAFSRFFSTHTRKTFSGFLQELRLQKAARLLTESDNSVTEICYECGYNNISNFNKQFLIRYKTSPRKYKRAFLEKNN
ncbi:MAG: AraC family transcriptional regulator [Chitinophagaceae bacterium]|nr:AraC family transcriptional regulator [Chitinophagaceae bacterium]MCW5928414.1 AraC family transcriptional regulator [Chitinophagaceae bacterium]